MTKWISLFLVVSAILGPLSGCRKGGAEATYTRAATYVDTRSLTPTPTRR